MPVYEYRCKTCGKKHEVEHGFQDERPTKCPSCGGQLVRVFHPIGLVFKGSGFHKTDYSGSARSKGSSSGGSSEAAQGESKPAEGKSSDVKSSETKSTDAKPTDSKSSDAKPAGGSTESSSGKS